MRDGIDSYVVQGLDPTLETYYAAPILEAYTTMPPSLNISTTWIVYFDLELQSVQAYHFNLSYCIKTYRTDAINGFETTQVTKIYEVGHELTSIQTSNVTDVDVVHYNSSVPGDNTTYYLDTQLMNILVNLIDTLLTFNITADSYDYENGSWTKFLF